MTTRIFALFPHDLYSDIKLIRDDKVYLIEHPKFFDRTNYGDMRLNILKPIYHRLTMICYFEYLKKKNIDVTYVKYDEDWQRIIKNAIKTRHLCLYDPVDRDIEADIDELGNYDIYETPRFIMSTQDLIDYDEIKTSDRQTSFYAWCRGRTDILMKNSKPIGGKLTYDSENRESPYSGMADDAAKSSSKFGSKYEKSRNESNVKEAVKYVVNNIDENSLTIWNATYDDIISANYDLDDLDIELRFPYTHSGAKKQLSQFVKDKLDNFGKYQDAMLFEAQDRSLLYHSGLSVMMNVGLITPQEIVDEVLKKQRTVAINNVEGFIRQVLGWREFARYTYEYNLIPNGNYFQARKKISDFWYGGTESKIEPIDIVVSKAWRFGYLHHIERLMIVANHMMLSRVRPTDVYRWFTEFSLDSYDWVMEYNVYVMATFSAGPGFTTKPYISSSNYVIKMSDYTKGDSKDWADDWDILFWQFMKDHASKIKKIPRLSMLLKHAESNLKKLGV